MGMSKHDEVGLLHWDTADLLAQAAEVRSRQWGNRVTFSPKVFIPLTKLCRDRCGYCTFAQPPARVESPYLSPDEVVAIARSGAEAGCHEALFTLGERPELRYPAAAQWLADHGYDSTVGYLAAMCQLVLDETGLLPHANAGALTAEELALLRPVAPSQGMMIESLADLGCHHGAPDKDPDRRLATLEAAGELNIAFTTGVLVGIGETAADRLEALEAIAGSHRRHGHIQEVIVQNFRPKPGTAMHNHPDCDPVEYLRTIAIARLVLPPEIHLQAPPNLSEDFGVLLSAGIDDWGGVSPVTADHVNPERPWPDLERLRTVTHQAGFTLAPRLTVYPEVVTSAHHLVDEALRFCVADRADAEGLGRDDPGAVFVQRITPAAPEQVDDGTEVIHTGPRSTAWYSGGTNQPPLLRAPHEEPAVCPKGAVAEVLGGVAAGHEVSLDEIVTLFEARGPEVQAVCDMADALRSDAVGETVTWVHNRNINYTNVCTFKCRFCGFSKGPLSLNLRGTPYLLTLDDIAGRVAEAWEGGATEVCLQGGIHPDFDGEYYIDVARAVKQAAPGIHIHGFTALEVTEGARRLGEDLASYLRRLREAGLATLPGTAAEILDDSVREVICPDKITTDEWLEAHRTAHEVGLRSNVTIMFGHVEQPVSWARHLIRTRDLQRSTGGFTEFVPLPFVHMAAPLYLQRKARRGPTFREALLMHAVGRIAYRGLIDNIQVSWPKLGSQGSLQALRSGANDLGGTLINENISRAAGAAHGQAMTPDDFAELVAPLGRPVAQRTTLYRPAEPAATAAP